MTEYQMLRELENGVLSLPPLELEARRLEVGQGARRLDILVTASWEGQEYEFAAELKARSIPKAFSEALQRARSSAAETGRLPMVVVPYLRSAQLDELARNDISGIDLCGNGVLVVPGRLFVYRTGRSNRYPESLPGRYSYRGTTSIVPRVFLSKPSFTSSSEVLREIRQRGGDVAASTVSKALKRMEEDLVVKREGRAVSLLQADTLLDKLRESYVPPRVEFSAQLRLEVPWRDLVKREAGSGSPAGLKLALSGAASAERWAVVGRADTPVIYCDSLSGLLARWLPDVEEDSRFPDVTVCETTDAVAFFDVRRETGIPYAAPVQTFLELSTGDKRDRETAEQLRSQILASVGNDAAGPDA